MPPTNPTSTLHGATRLIHGGGTTDLTTGSVNVPIYQTSTFRQEEIGGTPRWEYSRTGNPTRAALESLLAELEDGTHGFAFASGMAAITAVISLFDEGDEILISSNVYGGTYRVLDKVFSHFGIGFSVAQGTSPDDYEAAMGPKTVAVLMESPANPLLSVTDISAVSEVAHRHGLLSIVDNTFMTPWLQRPLELGADIVVHSATKYLGGHSDLVAGAVIVRDDELARRLAFIQNSTGGVLGPFDSFLLIRGIKTLGVRMDRHVSNAQIIAEALAEDPEVAHVHYPGLEDDPSYETNRRQATGAGGMLSFELAPGHDHRIFFKSLRLVALAESLGGVESLACHPATMTHAAIPREERVRAGITDGLIRLSVGIEDADDILADVRQAIRASSQGRN
ncbi:MAG: PLP-dependent aspartate aminotransferase family protein [Atopobiaceae bacterium]|jgi:cystathionine beta-lyase|nr:PLP-dependent aspartate aminotransferase family protein [Atopobiaceae bacterium]MCH4179923.1 PLP-dependent aspartate aminotransferase family protein [Atopobiaceae bacterium]MCH4213674.1 PLP-dependent aspartate aminotransferase family protein [Atopobiaceae bacterium]MCH4230201.1 PLP-dependent aspartate aminotransferase family protein [Atopobiaceae bacterium]MCH4275969.1 PLP-dependent aspartate aminotransferase family protein [Atopobiaceae bacterium]